MSHLFLFFCVFAVLVVLFVLYCIVVITRMGNHHEDLDSLEVAREYQQEDDWKLRYRRRCVKWATVAVCVLILFLLFTGCASTQRTVDLTDPASSQSNEFNQTVLRP